MLRTFDSGYNSDCLEQYKTKISPVESYNNETYVLLLCSYWALQYNIACIVFRNDEKTAQDYKVQGGSVLHLVLALRGGE